MVPIVIMGTWVRIPPLPETKIRHLQKVVWTGSQWKTGGVKPNSARRKIKQKRNIRPKKKDSCVQVSEVKRIRVGRSKNIFILDFFFITNVQRL